MTTSGAGDPPLGPQMRLFGCADDLKAVKELSETNNCASYAFPVTVIP